MQYNELLDFVENHIPKKMQHIYLPLLISKLVDSDGHTTIRQLAQSVLSHDESVSCSITKNVSKRCPYES